MNSFLKEVMGLFLVLVGVDILADNRKDSEAAEQKSTDVPE